MKSLTVWQFSENDMDRQTQDILHNIELNENSQYDYICQGFTCRIYDGSGEKAKDIKSTAPICSWMKENRKVISDLERLLGDVRKQEKQAQKRSYTNRTGVMKKQVTLYNHDPYHINREVIVIGIKFARRFIIDGVPYR